MQVVYIGISSLWIWSEDETDQAEHDCLLAANSPQATLVHYSCDERMSNCTKIRTFLWYIGGSVKSNILKYNRYFSVHLSLHNCN